VTARSKQFLHGFVPVGLQVNLGQTSQRICLTHKITDMLKSAQRLLAFRQRLLVAPAEPVDKSDFRQGQSSAMGIAKLREDAQSWVQVSRGVCRALPSREIAKRIEDRRLAADIATPASDLKQLEASALIKIVNLELPWRLFQDRNMALTWWAQLGSNQ
jgi:hypothetical protein